MGFQEEATPLKFDVCQCESARTDNQIIEEVYRNVLGSPLWTAKSDTSSTCPNVSSGRT